jgi:hypothetical protein
VTRRARTLVCCRAIAATLAVVTIGASSLPAAIPGGLYPAAIHRGNDRPHPAVARVIVPEGDATSYGSGTLIDVRDQFGLVITNWHVVRDGTGDVEVVFPDGFRSKARPLKVDADWDLAALVVWRPPVPPVAIAALAPQPGDELTICGYGTGQYRAATGRCTQYYAPKMDLPQHMVELDVEARQGDSGGPIFNDRGELAGVLFGAGGGTTLGSFGGRVESFLASLAPDIGPGANGALAHSDAAPAVDASAEFAAPVALPSTTTLAQTSPVEVQAAHAQPAALWTDGAGSPRRVDNAGWEASPSPLVAAADMPSGAWFEQTKTALAAVGVVAIVLQVLRAVR